MSEIIKPRIDGVPAALASLNQWVVWKLVPKKDKPGKFTKVPYDPKYNIKASSTKSSDWGSFDQACDAYLLGDGYDGIGFVFTANDPFVGIDLDGCFDDAGNLNDDGHEVISLIDSYTERSVSGKGLHVICSARLPGTGHCDRKTGREIYQEGRFFTITAEIVAGKSEIHERQAQVKQIYDKWFGQSSVEQHIATELQWDKSAPVVSLDDLTVEDYTKNLIRHGENASDFLNDDGTVDRSMAMFFVARQMVFSGANKETILTILTEKDYFLAEAALERRGNRSSAIEWVWKYTVAKVFRHLEEEKNLFDSVVEGDITDEEEETVSENNDLADEETESSAEYVKGNFNRNALIYLSQETPLVREEQQFFRYNSKYWEKVDEEKFESDVHIALSKGKGAQGMTMAQINNTIKAVKRFSQRKSFRISPTKLCFKNGVLDLDGWDLGLINETLLPHSPKHWVLNSLNFNYSPKAECPEWMKFLDSVFEGDAERIELLQQWFGYNLIYDYRYQKMLIVCGESRSGKGTITHILRLIVGAANYVGTSLKGFTTDFGLQQMLHAKAIVVPDAIQVEKAKINAVRESLLNITSGDVISINRKHKDYVVGKIPGRITLVANQVPRFADEYDALFNRYMVLPMRVSFAGREDVRLVNKLESEIAGIFNWAVQGLTNLGDKGKFTEPTLGVEEAREMRELANPVKTFIEKFVIPVEDPEVFVSVAEVYDLYERFCEDIDMKPLYSPQFGKRLIKHIPTATSVSKRVDGVVTKVYKAIKLNMEALSEHIHIDF
jgi:P4 family phage/plasmid primase-like protien